MKKDVLIKNLLTLVLCFSLIMTSIISGENIGEMVNKKLSCALEIPNEKEETETTASQNIPCDDSVMVGFGGGGYEESKPQLNDKYKDIEELKKEASKKYKTYKKSGDIHETTMGKTSQTVSIGKVMVNNKTEEPFDLKAALNKKTKYKKLTKDKPYILIYHTHTTEGYELLNLGWYSNSYNSRTRDKSKSVVRVGNEIAEKLRKKGFKVIHDTTIYDEPYTGAYSVSRKGIEKILKKYPTIGITLDIHRDAIKYESGTKCKPTTEVNGKKAAQVMIISGKAGGYAGEFPNWQNNLGFALDIQKYVSAKYPELMRPVFFCHRKYNMDITPTSLLLEFGTDANTLEEAVYSGSLIGECLGDILNKELK